VFCLRHCSPRTPRLGWIAQVLADPEAPRQRDERAPLRLISEGTRTPGHSRGKPPTLVPAVQGSPVRGSVRSASQTPAAEAAGARRGRARPGLTSTGFLYHRNGFHPDPLRDGAGSIVNSWPADLASPRSMRALFSWR